MSLSVFARDFLIYNRLTYSSSLIIRDATENCMAKYFYAFYVSDTDVTKVIFHVVKYNNAQRNTFDNCIMICNDQVILSFI